MPINLTVAQLIIVAHIHDLNRNLANDPDYEYVSDDIELWTQLGVTTCAELDAWIEPMPMAGGLK